MLTSRQQLAIAALVGGANRKQAAKAARVNESTLRRWFTDSDEFTQELSRATGQAVEDAVTLMRSNLRVAVETLLDVMQAGESEASRVRAAQVLLDGAFRMERDVYANLAVKAPPTFIYEREQARPVIYLGVKPEPAIPQEVRDEVARFLSGEEENAEEET